VSIGDYKWGAHVGGRKAAIASGALVRKGDSG